MTNSKNEIMEPDYSQKKRQMRRIALVSGIFMMVGATLTITLIQISGYAGTLDDTQFGFNAETIRNYFALMSSSDLGLFVAANLADYLFILFYGLFFFSTGRLISWNYKEGLAKKLGLSLAWIGVIASILDGIENMFLLSMTADPVGFAAWLAIAHSSFAVTKMLFMNVAMVWTMVGFVVNRTPLVTHLKPIQIV